MAIKTRKTTRPTLAVLAVMGTGALAACSTLPSPSPVSPVSSAFNRADFVWSQAPGRGGIQGTISSKVEGSDLACVGSVGLTPATRFTDARMQTLYGSTNRARLPADVVRARTVSDPSEDYRDFVRSTPCQNNSFAFDSLPDGRWYVILPARVGDGPVQVLMQQVQIRNGRTVSLSL